MKKVLLLVFLCVCLSAPFMHAARQKTAQSFLFTHPVYDNVQAMQFLWRDAIGADKSMIKVTPLYQKSFCSRDLAPYFLFNCKREIFVAGDATANAVNRDVRAEWLGLPSTFSGTYSIAPQQTQYATTISGYYHLKATGWTYLERSWLGLIIPVASVANALHPQQTNSSNTAGPVTGTEIIQALNNPNMIWGKFAPCTLKKTSVPEVRFLFGTNWETKHGFLLEYYTGISFPTEPRQHPNYIFGPVLGHNRHYQLIAGFSTEMPFTCEDSDIQGKVLFLAENNFLIRNQQLRSFDVFYNEWSRYLQLRKAVVQPDGTIIGSTETTPAVNAFTFPVRVHVNSFFNMAVGVSGEYCGFNAEVAWQMWAHTRERIQLMKSCCEGKPLPFEEYGIAGTGTSSASGSLINTLAPNDPVFVTFNKSDIKVSSGENRGAFSQSINGAVGYRCRFGFIGVGGFFEAANCDTAFKQWGVWGTIAYTI